MSSVVDIEYKKPTPESITVKLTRQEAIDLTLAYEFIHEKSPYFFSIWGRQSDLVNQVKTALGHKVTPPKPTASNFVTTITNNSSPFFR